jgi:hypothetical protein
MLNKQPATLPEFCQILPHEDNYLNMKASPFFLLSGILHPAKAKAHIT